MSNVASHDDGALEVYSRRDRILAQLLAYGINTLIEVYLYASSTFAWFTHILRDELCGVAVHLLQPYTVTIDLRLDVSVGRTADAHAYRTTCSVTWQTDDTYVVSKSLTAKLCA